MTSYEYFTYTIPKTLCFVWSFLQKNPSLVIQWKYTMKTYASYLNIKRRFFWENRFKGRFLRLKTFQPCPFQIWRSIHEIRCHGYVAWAVRARFVEHLLQWSEWTRNKAIYIQVATHWASKCTFYGHKRPLRNSGIYLFPKTDEKKVFFK